MENEKNRNIPLAVIAAISSVILAAAGGGAWLAWKSNYNPPKPISNSKPNNNETINNPINTVKSNNNPPVNIKPSQKTPITQAPENGNIKPEIPVKPDKIEQQVEIYLLKDTGTKIAVVPSKVVVKSGKNPEQILTAAFNDLLTSEKEPQLTSTIPKGTKLIKLDVKKDGIHVNLSQDFTSGGGTTSMTGRLAQILYTATSLDPKANVWIEVEGKKLEVLGGEGLELDQPLSRKKFTSDFEM
jgi:spore germination protein GerM